MSALQTHAIYRHRRTLALYRVLLESFSVERQEPSVVYISLAMGTVFDRGRADFEEKFELYAHSQHHINPKESHG